MEFNARGCMGSGGVAIGHIDLIAVGQEYKIVIQLQQGYQVLALRSEMFSGRISGILGKAVAPLPESAQ